MKKIYLLKVLILMVVVSCSNEPIEKIKQETTYVNTEEIKATLVDGRLQFDNKVDFKTSIEYMKSLNDDELENLMYTFYNEGFEPLYPFYNENDEERIREFVDKKNELVI